MKQKKIFLTEEGNSYFRRNKLIENKNINFINNLIISLLKKKSKILEIGCGKGDLLNLLTNNLNYKLFGIDPSKQALQYNKNKKIFLKRGTADDLKFPDNYFNLVIFGFCLYLVDKNLLFKAAAEADRVLKNNGYLLIYDFFSKKSLNFKYLHHKKITTHKMNYSSLFSWHPHYKIVFKKIGDSKDINKVTKINKNKISIYILKKNET
jgi:ubiquinone/menaquinone biosynthesis C-methylase UbiE